MEIIFFCSTATLWIFRVWLLSYIGLPEFCREYALLAMM